MAKKPLNPDSVKGGGMPALGRSSQGASAAANKRAGAGAAASKLNARALARQAGREAGRRLAIINNPNFTVTGRGGRQAALDRLFDEWYMAAKGVGKLARNASRKIQK